MTTAPTGSAYGITRTVTAAYGETIERLRALLKDEGFGVLTSIDVQATLKEKIGKEVAPYIILGACNPQLAARALEIEPDIGLLLPCNLIVAETAEGTRVGVVNPATFVEFTANPALREVSQEADARLRRVIERL